MAQQPHKQTRTILVVDDEVDICEQISLTLKMDGYTVLSASSGNKAFELTKTHAIDAIISDVRMADGTGIELLEKLKVHGSKPDVFFFMSAYADKNPEELRALGADEVFSKPYDIFAFGQRLAVKFLGEDEI